MHQKTIAYECSGAKIEVAENADRSGLLYRFSRQDDMEYRMTFDGPQGSLISNYKTLENDIASRINDMATAYDKTSFIRNKKNDAKKINTSKISKKYVVSTSVPVDGGYLIKVEDSQDAKTLDVTRTYYISKEGTPFLYLVKELRGDISDFTPISEEVKKSKDAWVKRLEEEVINCILNELQDVKEYLDKSVFGDDEYGIIEYENGEYRSYFLEKGEYQFEEIASISDCYNSMYSRVAKMLADKPNKEPKWLMRKVVNNCRMYLAALNNPMFMAEIGALKGIMLMAGIEDIEKAVPEEIGIRKYFEKFSQISEAVSAGKAAQKATIT